MNIEDLSNKITKSKISKHREVVCQAVRPAIDIIEKKKAKPYLGCSRWGGAPDLPAGSEWPTYEMKPYRFLGQINFAEVGSSETGLPTNGLLSLFVAENPDEDEFYLEAMEKGYIRAIFTPEFAELVTMSSPNPSTSKLTMIEFSSTIDIPFDEEQIKDWPFNEKESDVYSKIQASLHKSPNYLLGYPSHYTLGYDPTPGPEWIPLLTIDSDDDREWCWNDGDKLMIFIERERLEKLDFSSLTSDAG